MFNQKHYIHIYFMLIHNQFNGTIVDNSINDITRE